MTILSIDPGKRIGYALFTDEGEDIERGVIQFDDWFMPIWDGGPINVDTEFGDMSFKNRYITQFVVEGYRHDPMIQQGGSLHEASQVIGAVRMAAAIVGIPVAVQYASILPVAMMHDGYEPPVTKTGNKKHLPDEDSAWLHGRYFLRSQGVLQ